MELVVLAVRYRLDVLIPVDVMEVLVLMKAGDERAIVAFGLAVALRVVRRVSK